jgi:hypothetical protein
MQRLRGRTRSSWPKDYRVGYSPLVHPSLPSKGEEERYRKTEVTFLFGDLMLIPNGFDAVKCDTSGCVS